MTPRLRSLLFRTMPRGVLQRMRCWHAPRVARRFTDAQWPFAPVVKALILPGDTVVDVGANMGYITARLAEYVGISGRVYAVEPVPDTFEMLKCTVRALSLEQVLPIHACASDREGTVWMAVPDYDGGGENLYESRVVSEAALPAHARRIKVRALRLDTLLADKNQGLRFMKIDVEGHETTVIKGAWNVIQQHRPALLVEIDGDPDDSAQSAAGLFHDLAAIGYEAFGWDKKALRRRRPGDTFVDYLFLQENHLEQMRKQLAGAMPIEYN